MLEIQFKKQMLSILVCAVSLALLPVTLHAEGMETGSTAARQAAEQKAALAKKAAARQKAAEEKQKAAQEQVQGAQTSVEDAQKVLEMTK